ncbi:thiamine ABC transporter substrate binding subunit [Edwardsiella ictaluri]|uniref:Thiamine-binding periplasmic protein n=1 Tax=Edwardsiella ictaluri TaxID=67780 RepID=A0ABY8GD30_EDWIC|nr:thiamine ABC transporter substrate binding subunit [Edwardsiella ictaluri]ELV7526436.1 thiamine ABC transporter substrate binding subunit [Edwardsiella ictaluri]KMQ79792.1 thiamine ABC transporter substrate-binding protein [Edwardsiella ictaluri]KOO56492.1 thiamine ABC transporter substrate-binding protein [Edwardsiella ictaluri]WFN95345.1 thiamine ABC transporter substrate binding subunit [Edwardsiella ictaluri]
MLKKLFSILALLTVSLLAQAAGKPVLTVYTYDSFAADWGPGPKIKQAFEQSCHCELRLVPLEDGVAILNRLRMEGKNSPADLVLGLDNNLLTAARQSGLFSPSQIDTRGQQIPGGWHDATFVPYDYGYFAFVYDRQQVKNPPSSLKQLVESPEKWRVIYQDPRTSTPGLGLLLWMQEVYGDQASAAWQKLAQKTVTVTKGWSEAYGLFLKGEADMVLSYTTSPAYHIIEEHNDRYAAAMFDEGHYLQVEVAGILKHSRQPALAHQFMQFITTPAFQNAIPTGNWMYPATAVPLPPAFAALPRPQKTLSFTADDVAQHRAEWIRAWQSALSR